MYVKQLSFLSLIWKKEHVKLVKQLENSENMGPGPWSKKCILLRAQDDNRCVFADVQGPAVANSVPISLSVTRQLVGWHDHKCAQQLPQLLNILLQDCIRTATLPLLPLQFEIFCREEP